MEIGDDSVTKQEIGRGKGIVGLSRCFKRVLFDIGGRQKRVVFVGSESTCLPIAELLAYAGREMDHSWYFIPNGRKRDARRLEFKPGYGFQLGDEKFSGKAGIVVLLGGLAMPSSRVNSVEIGRLVSEILDRDGKVVGVGFMGIFERSGWVGKVRFDYLMDVLIESVKVDKFASTQ